MTKTKHTPGPWRMYYNSILKTATIADDGTKPPLAKVKGEANAKLIAAAPDLLAALIECEKRMEELQKHTNYPLAWPRVMARQAIEKATT